MHSKVFPLNWVAKHNIMFINGQKSIFACFALQNITSAYSACVYVYYQNVLHQ